jgi:hypothetical protein
VADGDAINTGCEAPSVPKASYSDDFRSVSWFGTNYFFTPLQAAVVRVLWANWERKTPDISEHCALESADSAGTRLRDVFDKGKHPAWGTMVVPGNTKGVWRLKEPEKQ